MYRLLFQLVLRRLDPEVAHALAKRGLRAIRASRLGRRLIDGWSAPDPMLRVRALGLSFSTPLGVAAGLDKDASFHHDLAALGFGSIEVGTVTAQAQEGNPRPRITRVVKQRALINWMGFPNPGAAAVAERLSTRTGPGAGRRSAGARHVVGVNVGKSRAAALQAADSDYLASVRRLAPVADYIAVNVSSPNTPGLRELQAPDRLEQLIGGIRTEIERTGRSVPLLVKISPDLADAELDELAGLAVRLGLDGIIAVNTTVDHQGIEGVGADGRGGLSGPPLATRASAVLRRLRAATDSRLALVSVGGVESGQDVWDRLQAGATLVQAYTALVYHGPGWPRRVNRELAALVRGAGYSSLQDALDDLARSGSRAPLAS